MIHNHEVGGSGPPLATDYQQVIPVEKPGFFVGEGWRRILLFFMGFHPTPHLLFSDEKSKQKNLRKSEAARRPCEIFALRKA